MNIVKKTIRKVAYMLGFVTEYHVAAIYNRDSHFGFSIISLQLSIRPWLHKDNYQELVDYVNEKATNPSSTPSITSITRLGI